MTRRKTRPATPYHSQKLVPRQPWHRWTDEELNLLTHCRKRHWSYARIQRKHFPLFTENSLKGAYHYHRVPRKERAHRASIVASSITISQPAPQPEDNIGVHGAPAFRCEEDNQTLIPIDGTNRYNLRPNRHTSFQESQAQYPIDRVRFPHFYKSYKNHLKLDDVPDGDYAPPPHSPTPDPSDRSPSVISSPPSAASSLELFGLEPRPLSSSDSDSAVAPSLPNDGPSSEFLNLEDPRSTP
jgi:hypothetical protein